jgi:hypothetical protein
VSADLLARLIEAGTPAALVGEVAMALASAQAAAAANVEAALAPTKGALRMRAYRERHAASPNVTCDASDAQVTVGDEAPSLDKKAPQTPKKINPIPCECDAPAHVRAEPLRIAMLALIAGCIDLAGKPVKAHRIPTDWQPRKPLPDTVASLVTLWPPGRVDRERDGFRDYWATRQRDAARSDWDRVWWNRIRDQHDRIMREASYANSRGNHNGSGRPVDGFTSALRRASAQFDASHAG